MFPPHGKTPGDKPKGRLRVAMALYTKCFKCGGWREMPEDPSAQLEIPTGMMMNLAEPPAKLCRCHDDTKGSDRSPTAAP